MIQPDSWAMEWTTWLFAGAVVLAYAAAVWTAVRHPQPRPELLIAHVVAATLIGLVAWSNLADVSQVAALTSAPADLLTTTGMFVVGVVVAIVGILRRRSWGVVLGIGLAGAHVLGSAAALIQIAALEAQAVAPSDGTSYFAYIAPTIVMDAVPSLVAIGLLAWPLRRRQPTTDGEGRERPESATSDPSPADPPH